MRFQLLLDHEEINKQVLNKIDYSDIYLIMKQQNHIQVKDNLTSHFNNHQYLIVITSLSFESKVHSHTDKCNINQHSNFFNDAIILA